MKMLFHCSRFCISMIIVFTFCQVLESIKMRTNPKEIEVVMKEGEDLLIEYTSYTRLKFVDAFEKPINTLKCSIYYVMNNRGYVYKFKKPNITYRDTGWYGCADYNYVFSTNSSDTEVDWLYVYVKSDTNLFVEADTNIHLSAVIGDNIVIPCRTTLPDLKPILIKSDEDELNEVPFDPKIGFTIRNSSLEDNNSTYKCLIEKNSKNHTVSYVLFVLKETLPEPKIQVNDLFITRGQDLKINCTVEMKSYMDFEFGWNMPQKNNSRKNIQQFIKHLDGNVLVTSQLTIFNVTIEDSGNYECVVSSMYDIKKIEENITVYDPQIKLIELLPADKILYFRIRSGSSMQFVVDIVSYIEPYLQWFKPNCDEIVRNSDNQMIEVYNSSGVNDIIPSENSNLKMVTYLKITSSNIIDSGNYTLQAKKGNIIERIIFTVDVIGEPISKLTHIDSNYLLNKTTEFRCEIISNPPPNIKWSFLKCPNYPSVENSTVVHLTNATQTAVNNSNYRFESILKMPIEMSGKITCKACNDEGCDSKTENIKASVPVPPFFNETNMNQTEMKIVDLAEGQHTVILRCFAEGMPKPTLTWYKDNVMLKENDQYFFKHNRQELHIKYFNLHDSGRYSCRANNSIDTNETYQQITVKNTKWSTFDIVLVTSVSILGFILIILAIYFTIKIHRGKKIRKELMEAGLLNFEEGALESLNPNLTVDEQGELLPYDKKWEFPRKQLKLKEQLDSGQFGVVMKAEAIGICKNESVTTVAVKMVRRTTNSIYIRALVSELKIMVHLGKHLNVINLLGACTKNISKCM